MATMTAAAREKYNEYQRKWRREHPDKVKANRERYWERKAAAMTETPAESEGSKDE